jgi:hypothetical protein
MKRITPGVTLDQIPEAADARYDLSVNPGIIRIGTKKTEGVVQPAEMARGESP